MRIGVEVGGTFTDLVLIDGDRVRVEKVPSTPAAPDRGALDAIEACGADLAQVLDLVHGSTVATNAILERKGAAVCLLVTEGFRDILFLQRHNRRRIYDLFYRKPEPVVQRRNVHEIAERIAADGTVIGALDAQRATAIVDDALGAGAHQAVAICLLNSYANPVHEEQLARIVRERFPEVSVTCSVEVNREFREYERCSTTTLAAYVQPVIDGYLRRFERALAERGYRGRFSIMQSNGGRLPAAAMGRNAITSLYSGPAAGVIGALRQAGRSGLRDLITLDIGGTSTDVCLIENGEPALSGETEIDGLPIKTPVIDIATVGAGGGSLVWIDDGGLLRVGPRSAGAEPGPACYARGGTDPTITDAHVIRGTVRPESFLGGKMRLDAEASVRAFAPLAQHLGLSVELAADSAVRVAESNIVRAIQRISTEKGKDPRDYALVPFGGAGPMQAARVAEELGIRTVLVPPHAGVLSAFGLLASDYVHYETRTHRLRVEPGAMAEFREVLAGLERSVRGYLRELGLTREPLLSYVLEMRYASQAFEIPVDLPRDGCDALTAEALAARFEAAHRRVFEFAGSAAACEVVSFRVGGAVTPDAIPALRQRPGVARGRAEIRIFDRGQSQSCLDIQRGALDGVVPGPALIEDGTSTIFVPAGWAAEADANDNLLMRPREQPMSEPIVTPADQAVITQALLAIANEMGAKLIRSAHSPIVREASDCSTALLDAHGNVVAQAELIPLQLGSISHTFAPCAAVAPPQTLAEGDFYINNDPFHGGQHVPDVFLFSPIFLDRQLIGFSASVAHHIDLGGGAPGLNPDATDVHQEGIIFPPSRYNLERDWSGGPLERLLRANIRMPEATVGDFNAQFAANRIGAERLKDLCYKHGRDVVLAVMTEVQSYSERRIQAALAAVPEGVYRGEDALDDDGQGSGPVPVRATVTIGGGRISVDFAGTADQVKSNMNCPFASTVGATASVIKSVLTDADIPFNSGSSRVLTVNAPYGSILNPKPPAPVRARLLPSYRVYNAVMKALAQALPERVIAAGYDTTSASCLSHLGPDGYSIYLEIMGGGFGAGPASDGCDAVDSPLSNCSNIPVEAMDMTYDFFRVVDYSLIPDSGGQGRQRGGLGFQRIYEVLADDVAFATYADRFKIAPEGLFGGAPGRTAETFVLRGNEKLTLRSKQSFPLRKGDRLVMRTGGGAGYGSPTERAPASRERDRLDGFMTS